MHTLLKRKLPKIFHSSRTEQPAENIGISTPDQVPLQSSFSKFNLCVNKRIFSFHNYMIPNKCTKLICIDSPFSMVIPDRIPSTTTSTSSSHLIDLIKNLYSKHFNPSYDDTAVQKHIKFTYNNDD
ncbi:hypothetical protein RclHR1_21400003 [Rhizophagus clarus]|uniref:Uncharacterized protein n=1 Tax=Rhizophagus clarus TaxID=94130 RepID=A0A2Z6RLZ4_9GLOM|nr:hypothetical protein RclHR1_21400003 [Rhizophagus clarus]GES83000.1 hypothetical protein RCL_jg19928.t1 [Rhizophagus clarus]